MQVFLVYELDGKRKVDGPIEGIPAIVERMREIHAMGVKEIEQVRTDAVCDFCSHPKVVGIFSIPAGGVIASTIHEGMRDTHLDKDGKWGACDACKEIILSGRETAPAELAIRSVENGRRIHPDTLGMLPIELVAEMVAAPHSLFWTGWDGSDPEPVITDEELLEGGN
jgi:hypothetical protein